MVCLYFCSINLLLNYNELNELYWLIFSTVPVWRSQVAVRADRPARVQAALVASKSMPNCTSSYFSTTPVVTYRSSVGRCWSTYRRMTNLSMNGLEGEHACGNVSVHTWCLRGRRPCRVYRTVSRATLPALSAEHHG